MEHDTYEAALEAAKKIDNVSVVAVGKKWWVIKGSVDKELYGINTSYEIFAEVNNGVVKEFGVYY